MNMDYVSVSVPANLVKDIDEELKKTDSRFTSRSEFIKDAIRRLLDSEAARRN